MGDLRDETLLSNNIEVNENAVNLTYFHRALHCAELPDLPDQDEPAAAEHKGGAAQNRRRVRPTDLASGEEKRRFAIVSSLCNFP